MQADFSDRSGSDLRKTFIKVDYDGKCNKNKHVYKILKTIKSASKVSELFMQKNKGVNP
jgi:hypothetical protein